jgi:hypothetical protein
MDNCLKYRLGTLECSAMPRPKGPDRVQFILRVPRDVHSQLEQKAKTRGVSMNAELVRRLEISLANDRRAELFETGLPAAIGDVVAVTMHETGKFAGLHSTMTVEGSLAWYDDPYAYDQAARAATAIIDWLRPHGAIKTQRSYSKDQQAVMIKTGRMIARSVALGIAVPKSVNKHSSRAAIREIERNNALRSDLGHLAERLGSAVVPDKGDEK